MGTKALYEALKRHIEKGRVSFHTPGHKGALFKGKFASFDLTELPDTDSLFAPSGAVLEAEGAAARVFGAERTLFSAGGCTLSIQTMLRLAFPCGGKMICSRRVHISVINAMALSGIEPVWIVPEVEKGLFCGVSAEAVRRAFSENGDAGAVFVTSPDYFGTMSDIKAIAAVCREFKRLLLVDNAHGSHLKFLREDRHPLTLGADMTADSAHKTLPVLTGGAWLHINNERFIREAKGAMALFGSTSPSYPVMVSLDLCADWLAKEGRAAFDRLYRQVESVKEVARGKGMYLPGGLRDPARIVLGTAEMGMSGEQTAQFLREHSVEPEYAEGGYVVLIPSPFNSDEDFDKLIRAIEAMPVGEKLGQETITFELPERVMGLRQAMLSQKERVKTREAIGRVAAESLSVCPPGVPLSLPGEKIDGFTAEILLRSGISDILVVK